VGRRFSGEFKAKVALEAILSGGVLDIS